MHNESRPRFSLKVLLLLVALVGIVCAYHASWINQRQALREKYAAKQREYETQHWAFSTGGVFPRHTPKSAHNLLWLLGEKYHETINVPVRAKNLLEANDEMALWAADERSTAESLFPESLFYLRINGFNEPNRTPSTR